MKVKLPKFLSQRPDFLRRRPHPAPPKKLQAAVASRRMAPGAEDSYSDEPATRLSSAFLVVLILHVVAVGGIYAFNSIKAHRRGFDTAPVVKADVPPVSAGAAAAEPKEAVVSARPNPPRQLTVPTAVAPAAAATLLETKSYHVKNGDTLPKIAAAAGVSVAELQFVNTPKELAGLHPGQIINVPARKGSSERPPAVAESAPAVAAHKADEPAKAPGERTYEVKRGDTATSIAKRSGVSVAELLKLNKISDPTKLQLGQALKLPPKKVN